jgi:asparagine synthase (glutamine-hydrolysing)
MKTRIVGSIVRQTGITVSDSTAHVVESLNCQVLLLGRITNRNELVRRIGISSALLQDDSILVAHAYRTWGKQITSHLIGKYRIVLYDCLTDSALLIHDGISSTSFYYDHDSKTNEIRFATHLLDLLDSKTMMHIDEEYLADFLALGCITNERTPFLSIRRLQAGCYISWSDGYFIESRLWNLAELTTLTFADEREYELRFRILLEASVQEAIGDSSVVWAELSGGLDSSSITSIAAQLEAPNLSAWSVYSPSFAQADERQWMKEVVEKYTLPWHLVNIEKILPFSLPPGEFIGEPSLTVINEAQAREQKVLFQEYGVEVLLSGHGGDAVLGAFPGSVPLHLADSLFVGDLFGSLKGIYQWRQKSVERRSYTYWLQNGLLKPAFQHFLGQGISTGPKLAMQSWFEPSYSHRMHLEQRRKKRYYTQGCQTPSRQYLADSLLIAANQAAIFGQKERNHDIYYPLLNRSLIDFMIAVPFEQKMRPSCDRYLQRRALKNILPEPIRRRAGKGIGSSPFTEGLSRSPQWIDYLTRNSRLAAYGIADPDRWRLAVQQAAVGQTYGDQFFHAGLAVEIWFRQLENYRG